MKARIAMLAMVGLIGFAGIARADSAPARACIVALNDGRQCCLKAAHDTDLSCMISASLLTGAAKNAAVKACSVEFSSTSNLCTAHYVDDVAACRSNNP